MEKGLLGSEFRHFTEEIRARFMHVYFSGSGFVYIGGIWHPIQQFLEKHGY